MRLPPRTGCAEYRAPAPGLSSIRCLRVAEPGSVHVMNFAERRLDWRAPSSTIRPTASHGGNSCPREVQMARHTDINEAARVIQSQAGHNAGEMGKNLRRVS